MFKGFQNTQRNSAFNGFPALNFQMNNQIYGLSGGILWLDPLYGLNTQVNLAAISTWQSRVGQFQYTQSTVATQPRLILSDPTFNNNPVIDFNSAGKGLFSAVGPNIKGSTLVLVYQYVTPTVGGNMQNRIVGDSDNSNARSTGFAFSHGVTNNTLPNNRVGFNTGAGFQYASSAEYTTTSKIMIANQNYWYSNNSSVTVDAGTYSSINSFLLTSIGGSTTSFSGVFKIAEILVYNYSLNLDQITYLSSTLNTKYAIY